MRTTPTNAGSVLSEGLRFRADLTVRPARLGERTALHSERLEADHARFSAALRRTSRQLGICAVHGGIPIVGFR
jgi:hypothetical protein